ncbi:antibiotic biosynthesis monooxygenase [Oceanobacillus oncorhynchi]|uniref:antibiotic biosynthesis monooxygenase n=1 Tax=Oceanobacillus oncorhynchi TaxID=545501 RepID=UPI00299F8D6A|nr:antibiotic biosynthesis monooxygenase [Oceanobacillus oncorhynchi]
MKVVNTLRVKKGKVNEVAALFSKAKSVHTFNGFVFMEVLIKENTEEYDELQVCTTWEDHASFEVWRESRETRKAHESQDKQEKENNLILGSEISTFEIFVQHHPA